MNKNHNGYKTHSILGMRAQSLLHEASPFLSLLPGYFLLFGVSDEDFQKATKTFTCPIATNFH